MLSRRRKWSYIFILCILFVIALLIVARLYLPIWLKNFVNNELNNLPGYNGEVADIDVHLYRGAYTVKELRIRKTDSGIPVPFVAIKTMDLSIEWRALFNGRVVAQIKLFEPEINFAVNARDTDSQTGEGVDWTDSIKKLMPVDINRVTIINGRIAYRNFSTEPKINLHVHAIQGEITNLRNVVDKDKALPSTINFTGTSIGNGKLNFNGRMDALTLIPEIEFIVKLEKVDLPSLNNYFEAFALINVKKGEFDLYSEIAVHKGVVKGYVKPIASHISLIDLRKEHDPFQLLWEAVASVVLEIFTNHSKDQFATKIPLSGDINNIHTGNWKALIGIVKNAFIEALKKSPDGELIKGKF